MDSGYVDQNGFYQSRTIERSTEQPSDNSIRDDVIETRRHDRSDEIRLAVEASRLTVENDRLKDENNWLTDDVLKLKNEMAGLLCVNALISSQSDETILRLAIARSTIDRLCHALAKIAIGPMSVSEGSQFGLRAAALAAHALDGIGK
jgi:hypothetical protein